MAFNPFSSFKGKQDSEPEVVEGGSREFNSAADSVEEASNVKM